MGKGNFRTPTESKPKITKKFVTGDYDGDPYSCAKFGAHPSKVVSGQMREI